MNKKFGWIIGTLVVAVVALGAFGTSVALADDGGPGQRTGRLDGEGSPEGAPSLPFSSFPSFSHSS